MDMVGGAGEGGSDGSGAETDTNGEEGLGVVGSGAALGGFRGIKGG